MKLQHTLEDLLDRCRMILKHLPPTMDHLQKLQLKVGRREVKKGSCDPGHRGQTSAEELDDLEKVKEEGDVLSVRTFQLLNSSMTTHVDQGAQTCSPF